MEHEAINGGVANGATKPEFAPNKSAKRVSDALEQLAAAQLGDRVSLHLLEAERRFVLIRAERLATERGWPMHVEHFQGELVLTFRGEKPKKTYLTLRETGKGIRALAKPRDVFKAPDGTSLVAAAIAARRATAARIGQYTTIDAADGGVYVVRVDGLNSTEINEIRRSYGAQARHHRKYDFQDLGPGQSIAFDDCPIQCVRNMVSKTNKALGFRKFYTKTLGPRKIAVVRVVNKRTPAAE